MQALAILALTVVSQLQPLPPNLIPLDSDEGRKLLVESNANRDFFALSSQFLTQRSTSYCGVASSVMVLNALPIGAPEAKEFAPFRAFTQDNVFNAELSKVLPAEKVSRGGLTIDEVATLLNANHAEARPVYASDASLEKFRADVVANMKSPNDYVLVDFFRGALKQDTGAHWSPLAAYHEGTDRFLVLDVARFRYPPYWVKADELFAAMNTSDLDSGRSRGYVLVSAAKDAPPRVPTPPVGSKLMRMVIGALAATFVIGALFGALLTRFSLRKRLARAA